MIPRKMTHLQSGVTLIELMIGMALGLFIIGGVITVMLSNQQSTRAKQDLDAAQESFRFAASALSRMIRNSSSIGSGSTETQLNVVFPRAFPNCLNDSDSSSTGSTTDTFRFVPNPNGDGSARLECDNDFLMVPEVLADGFDASAVGFTYAVPNAIGQAGDEQFVDSSAISDWNQVIAVRVNLRTMSGLGTVLTATLRQKIVQP
jgi:Tfp pilus assembly protein PilW